MAAKAKNDVLAMAATAAIKLLQNPEVQDQIAQAGVAAVDAIKEKRQRQAERGDEPSAPSSAETAKTKRRPLKEAVGSAFGNQKLERRVQNLSENVRLLRNLVSGEAAEALGEVESVVDRLEVAVVMAANLPIGKRQKAHREIDSVLDELERAVFASVME